MTIAEDYIPLARKLAKKYTPKGMTPEDSDCLGVAFEALTKACGRLDRDVGKTSYIKKSIEGALKRHLTTQRVQGFSGLKRSRYAEAIIMGKEMDIPEEVRTPMESALGASVPLDEPSSFEDGERGTKEETLDMGVPSVEDDCIAMESSAYMKREVQDWISQFRHKEQLFIVEVMMGDKTVTQFCKDYRMSDVTAKKMRARIIEEGAESLSYVLYNLEKTP